MKLLTLFAVFGLMTFPAFADPAFVSKDGIIKITGQVVSVNQSQNDFVITYNDENIDVSMDSVDEETLDNLLDADIIKSGSYVTVTGTMEDSLSGPLIKANSINIYSDNDT